MTHSAEFICGRELAACIVVGRTASASAASYTVSSKNILRYFARSVTSCQSLMGISTWAKSTEEIHISCNAIAPIIVSLKTVFIMTRYRWN